MTILLDTQVWLWMLSTPERFGTSGRALLEDGSHRLLLSAASSWEIAIKAGLGKLHLPAPAPVFVPRAMEASGVTSLQVLHTHALAVTDLPALHRDPFDRLLVAQASVEGVPLMTADPTIARYDVETIRA